MSGCLISDDKLFQSRGAAAANILSPKELCVRPTTSVRVSAERSRLTLAYQVWLRTSWTAGEYNACSQMDPFFVLLEDQCYLPASTSPAWITGRQTLSAEAGLHVQDREWPRGSTVGISRPQSVLQTFARRQCKWPETSNCEMVHWRLQTSAESEKLDLSPSCHQLVAQHSSRASWPVTSRRRRTARRCDALTPQLGALPTWDTEHAEHPSCPDPDEATATVQRRSVLRSLGELLQSCIIIIRQT